MANTGNKFQVDVLMAGALHRFQGLIVACLRPEPNERGLAAAIEAILEQLRRRNYCFESENDRLAFDFERS